MKIKSILLLLILIFFVAGCGEDEPAPTTAPVASVEQSEETAVSTQPAAPPPPVATLEPTAIPPTPTPTEPLAATVNGTPIFLSAFEKEVARYEQSQAELGTAVPDYRAVALDALITQQLVIQAAADAGYVITEEMIAASFAEYRELAGEVGNFEAWLAANLWTEEEYRDVIVAELAETEMVTRVTADVPFVAEQVHARYLQVDDQALADQLLVQIQNGDDFGFLAQQHSLDRLTGENGGDMGYFARGSLLVPELEPIAFALEPGAVSDVIVASSIDGSKTVYYILQVIEKDAERPLPANIRTTMMQQAFQTWLDNLRQQAVIEKYVQ